MFFVLPVISLFIDIYTYIYIDVQKSFCHWVNGIFFKKISNGHISVNWKNMRIWENNVRNGCITNVFPIEVRCRGFITNSNSALLTKLGLFPLDKRKYIKKKVQDKARTASACIWRFHWVTTIQQSQILLGCYGLVVIIPRPRSHTWTQSCHLMTLSEAMLLYKHQSLLVGCFVLRWINPFRVIHTELDFKQFSLVKVKFLFTNS